MPHPHPDAAPAEVTPTEILSRPRTFEDGARHRNVVWQAPEVSDALDAFAERARRRPAGA